MNNHNKPGIDRVTLIGAGTMGCYNALTAAISGYTVTLYDASEQSLAAVPERQRDMANMLVGAGWCSEEDVQGAAQRTRVTSDLASACAQADLVNESVYEELALKQQVHAELDALCDPSTLLTTNSSALLVSEVERQVVRRERFAALHSHYASPLVDIVPGTATSSDVIDRLEAYVTSLRGVPLVLKKENPGYVLNAMLGSVLGTSLAMLVEGRYNVATIDASWVKAQEALMGPFALIDLFGLGVIRDAWLHRQREDALQAYQPAIVAQLESMLADGSLGMQSGQGFYHYPEPAYSSETFVDNADDECAALLQAALLAAAVTLVTDDIVSAEQVDLAWTVGMHAPWGPFTLMDKLGRDAIELRVNMASEFGLLLPQSAVSVVGRLDGLLSNRGVVTQ